MGRRYVRDKAGRFAAKGGGTKGKGGKMGKSAKNVKARAAYKSASSKVRKAQRDFKTADRKSSAAGGARTRAANASAKARKAGKYTEKQMAAKYQRAAENAYGASLARQRAVGKISGSKSGLTRVTNRLTNKRVAKAKVSEKRQKAATKAKAASLQKPLLRKSLASAKKAKATRAKTAAAKKAKKAPRTAKGKMAYDGPNKAASEARDRVIAKTKAKNAKKKVRKTAGKYTEKTAKGEYKRASREDRMQGSGATKARKRVIKKQTGKPAYQQRMGTEGGQTRLGRKKAPRAGSKTKAEKIRSKIESKKAANKALRGDEFKGAKKRKPPRTAKGKMAYDGPNKAASEARDRIVAKTKAIRAKKGIKAPTSFGGTGKYSRQGKLSKASKGSGAKQKYKKAVSTKRLLTGGAKANVSPSKAGGQAKAKVTRLNKSLRKGVKQGTGYAISDKGKAAKQRFTQLKRERGGATKGTGTAAQKRAGMSYRKSVAAFGGTTKGRVPKGSMPGAKTQKQSLKEMPRKQSFTGKGSKAQRRINASRDVKWLKDAAKASNTPADAKKNYLKRAKKIEGKFLKKKR